MKKKQRGFIQLHAVAIMPRRQTLYSAGYDIHADILIPIEVKPGQMVAIPTGLTYYCNNDEYLALVPRSGLGFKYQVTIQNSPATLDADFPPNEFKVLVRNEGDMIFTVNPGDRVCQAIFSQYLITDDDEPVDKERKGGLGHSGV